MKKSVFGQTNETSMSISTDQLTAPGIPCSFDIIPLFNDPITGEPTKRKEGVGPSLYEVKAKLSRFIGDINLNGKFGPADGASYILTVDAHQYIEIEDNYGLIRIDKNNKNELSMATATVEASDPRDARRLVAFRLSLFFDRISYIADIPIFIELFVVRNILTEVQNIFFVSPHRPCMINSGDETLLTELAPVYALYREAQNSNSPYYKLLCLYKIMEGLLGSLRIKLSKKARENNINIETPKASVPNHSDFPSGIAHLVGQPIKKVFDNFFQKEFRDAMAHFSLNGKDPLNVSAPLHWARFMDVAFVANLCARALIARHERSLQIFSEQNKPDRSC